MSEKKNINPEKISMSYGDKSKNHKLIEIIQPEKSSQPKYKYTYSEENNSANNNSIKNFNYKYYNTVNQNYNTLNQNSNTGSNNISFFSSNSISIQSPSKLSNNCETNYSINNISNARYINGPNKKYNEISYKKNQDMKFMSNDYNQKILPNKKDNQIQVEENEESNKYAEKDNYSCGNKSNIIRINKEEKFKYLNNKNNNYLNYNEKSPNRNYYITENKINKSRNIKNLIEENNPIFLSNDDNNSRKNSKLIIKKKIIKYYRPNNKFNKNITRNNNINSDINIFDDIRKKGRKYIILNNYLNNKNNGSYSRNNSQSQKKNHKFININNCTNNAILEKNNRNNFSSIKNNINSFSSKKNDRSESNNKYQYNIRIHNINVKKGMNHSLSYESERNNGRITSNRHTLKEYSKKFNLVNNSQNYDKKDLKIQNLKKIQVIEDPKTFDILVPIPQNKINYSCDFKIIGNEKKNYSIEETINERKTIKELSDNTQIKLINKNENNSNNNGFKIITQNKNKINNNGIKITNKKENISNNNIIKIINQKENKNNEIKFINENKNDKNIFNNNEFHEIIQKNKKIEKRPNWNLTNKKVKEKNLNYKLNKKKEEKPLKKVANKSEFNIENFEINIEENGNKLNGGKHIENKSTKELEKKEKEPNSKLLLSPNQEISFKAEYPRRDWNNITKPISNRPLSIEGKSKQVLLERSVEKILIKSNKPKNNWNLSNIGKKEINLILLQKKKENTLSKEKMQPFSITGKPKDWNIITKKESESNLIIKGKEKKKDNKENEEDDILFNDDYNKIGQNKMFQNKEKIEKFKDNADETNSEYDILQNLNNISNKKDNNYKYNNNEIPSGEEIEIINNRNGENSNGIEVFRQEIEEEENTESQNLTNQTQNKFKTKTDINNNISNNIYLKKKIASFQNKKKALTDPREDLRNNLKKNKHPKEGTQNAQYFYREIITRTRSELNDESEKNNLNKKETVIKNIDNNIENKNSEVFIPKSQTKYAYREQIIALSPNKKNFQISRNFSNQNNNNSQNGNIYNQNGFIFNTNTYQRMDMKHQP